MRSNQLVVNWIGKEVGSRQGDRLGAAALIETRRGRGMT